MPQLTSTIDAFLRRTGLTLEEMNALCDELGAARKRVEPIIDDGETYYLTEAAAGKGVRKSYATAHVVLIIASEDWVPGDIVTIINEGPGALSFDISEGATLLNGSVVLSENQGAQVWYVDGNTFRIL